MNLFTENRQTIKTILLVISFAVFSLPMIGQEQKNKTKIDYSIRSNILDPDTLTKGSDEYRIFYHFINWSYKEVNEIEILTLKAEFEKVGITTKDRAFDSAYSFFNNDVVFHKEQVELWEKHFKDLAPD